MFFVKMIFRYERNALENIAYSRLSAGSSYSVERSGGLTTRQLTMLPLGSL